MECLEWPLFSQWNSDLRILYFIKILDILPCNKNDQVLPPLGSEDRGNNHQVGFAWRIFKLRTKREGDPNLGLYKINGKTMF